MAKPIISSITPFDVADGTIIRFAYSGNQPYSNKIIIYKASTMEVVYQDTEVTMQLRHSIPGGLAELNNGVQYAIEVICYDNDGVASQTSNKVFFWCLRTADFYFTTITEGAVYETSSVVATCYYNQYQGDNIASYKFHLYDATKAEIFVTEMIYDSSNITYTFKGLDNLTGYYVRCEGISQKGVSCDTGYVGFSIRYQDPTSYAKLYTIPRDGNGVVDYYTNLVVIEDTSGKVYEYNNSMILLDDDDLTYTRGFNIDGDFTLAIKHTYAEGVILRCSNGSKSFELSVVPTEELYHFRYKLTVPNHLANYVLYSEPFLMDAITTSIVWIRRINDVYQLVFFTKEDLSDFNDLWLYNIEPISSAGNYDAWIDMTNMTIHVPKEDVKIWNQVNEPASAEEDNIWLGGNV